MSTRDVGNLRTRLSWEGDDATRSLEGFKRDLRGLRSEMNVARSAGREYTSSLKGMQQQSDILTRRFRTQEERVKELKSRYDESVRVKGEDAVATQQLQSQLNNATADMQRTEGQLERLNEEIRRMENPWHQLGDQMETAGKRLQDVGKGMTDFGKKWSMRVTAPIVGLGIAALNVGMDFEQGMSKVQALTGETEGGMASLEEQAKHLGETTRFSATQAAEGMAFLGMAGWDTQSILDGMPGLLNLAASAQMDLGRAADITSNIMAAFNIEAAEAGRISDILAHASSNSNTNVEQLGEAMKYVAPTANTLGLSIEDTASAIMSVSDAGIQGSQAGRAFGTSLLRLSNPTAAMKDEMKKLEVSFFDAEGAMKDLPEIIGDLETSMADYDDEQRAAALSTLFGTEAQRHWAIMLDTGSDALGENSKALEESEGAAENMAKTMQDNARGSIVEFQSALEGIGIALAEHMIPMVTDAVEWGTELVRKFGDLDEETQKNVVQIGLFAAALGPAAVIAGQATTAVGGIVSTGGKLFNLLGAASGGTGLLARVASLGPLGVGGIAVAGVAALAGGIYLLSRDTEQLHEISTEAAEGMLDQASTLEELVERYDELQGKSNLTNEELARYVDLQSEIEKATDPETILALHQEMENLRKNSEMSNDELDEMITLNGDIIEQASTVERSFTDKGNAIIDSTDAVREYIDSLRDMAVIELEAERVKALENETALRRENQEIGEEIRAIEEDIQRILDMREMPLESVKERIQEILDLQYDTNLTAEEQNELQRELTTLLDIESGKIVGALEHMQEQRNTLLEKRDLNNEEIEKLESINKQLEMAYLQNVGIKDEKAEQAVHEGNSLDILDEQLEKLRDQKTELQNTVPISEQNTDEYREAVGEIDNQISRMQTAKRNIQGLTSEAENYTSELGKDVDKTANLKTSPSIDSLNRELTNPLTRWINLRTSGGGLPGYAKGTDYHPGGMALVGEEGPELAKIGNRWSMLDFGITDLPRGTQVYTHDESKKIIRALNNMPAYASGVSPSGEANRVVGQLNNQQSVESTETVNLLTRIAVAIESGQSIQIEGREVMRATIKHFDEGMNNVGDRRQAAWGG